MRQFDPIFFTPPSGDTKKPRTMYKDKGGGDGGAAQRKAAEDARIAEAVKQINQVFSVAPFEPASVDINQFYKDVPNRSNGFNNFNSNANKPIDVPDGYELQNKPSTRNTNFMGGNSGGGLIGALNNQNNPGQRLFNKRGYDDAIAKAKAEADAKNAVGMEGREKTYSKISDDFTNNAMVDLDRDYNDAAREQKFTLARAGLTGGSRDVDSNQELNDRQQQGVLRATNLGIQAGNNARNNDNKTRTDLIASIYAGLTGDSAVQQAYEGMANNSRAAQDEAGLASLGGFFDSIKQQQQQAAYQQGFNNYGQAVQNQFKGYGMGNKGYNGNNGSY